MPCGGYLDYRDVRAQWQPLFERFFASETGRLLEKRMNACLDADASVFPPKPFRLFELLAPEDVRVVIVGQDPYHEKDQAAGIAFHVEDGVRVPPSLRNILKEVSLETGAPVPPEGSLLGWVRQGVFLMNTALTVQEGLAGSHAGWGWEALTDAALAAIARHPAPKVFMLWGRHARQKAGLLEPSRHLVLSCNHPSPLSANRRPDPFIGCNHFLSANHFLQANGLMRVDWTRTR